MLSNSPNQNKNFLLKGNLLKQNWIKRKQLRTFVLYNDGEIKYFNGTNSDIYRGSMFYTSDTVITHNKEN
jgi:hypothetical protein